MKTITINNIKFKVITETELAGKKTLYITTNVNTREEALNLKKYLLANGSTTARMTRNATNYQVSCNHHIE